MTDPQDRIDALVVGAGPTGLLLASELARRGLRCRVVDQALAPPAHPRAVAVHARTLELLDALDLADEAIAAGHKLHRVSLYAGRARLAHLSFDELDAPFPFMLSVPQRAAERALEGHLLRQGLAPERGVAVRDIAQDAAGVDATVVRADGATEVIHARWVLGCDGADSAVREAARMPVVRHGPGATYVLADVALEWAVPDDELHAWFGPEGVLVAAPLPDGGWRLAADCAVDTGVRPTPGDLAALLAARVPVKATVRAAASLGVYRVQHRQAEAYRSGRVFLAGDAAHVLGPAVGAGLNAGLHDAFNLAWKLALVQHGAARDALLDSYEAERHPAARALFADNDLALRAAALRGEVAPQAHDALVEMLASLEVVQERLRRAGTCPAACYRDSPIVGEHRASFPALGFREAAAVEVPSSDDRADFGHGPAPGERAPDAPVRLEPRAAAVRLFDLLRDTRHALLLFDGAAPTPEGYRNLERIGVEVTARYGVHVAVHVVVPHAARPAALGWEGSVLYDPDGPLHGRYGASSECLYLLRPDGYVGFRAQPADWDSLRRHLETLFGLPRSP